MKDGSTLLAAPVEDGRDSLEDSLDECVGEPLGGAGTWPPAFGLGPPQVV